MFDTSSPHSLREEPAIDAAEWYERGLALRKAGLFKQAIEQFERAIGDQTYALKAYAQMGLCYKSSRRYEEAVTAFRNALTSTVSSAKETVQILYVLGRTLESLGRIAEALEAYRWLRREDAQFRDVTQRIESISAKRTYADNRPVEESSIWTKPALQIWQDLLRNTKP